MRVLVVEDEPRMRDLLRKGLAEEGYSVIAAADGREAIAIAESAEFDIVVLDIMLPKMDGFEVARRLRQRRVELPILMLTARDAVRDIVTGLDSGADDYLTKPFAFEVLLARLRALTRRGPVPRPVRRTLADLIVDFNSHEVSRGGERIQLTRTEYQLLEFMLRHEGQVIPRSKLIEAVWGFESDIESNTLDAFIRLLRSKLEASGRSRLIHTIRGVGYCLRESE